MLNQEVDDLTRALAKIRLNREKIIRALYNINKRKSELLQDLQTAAVAAAAAATEDTADTNPHARGDLLTITNDLRDEFGIMGRVIRSGVTFVTIRNITTRKTYTRVWWNLK